MIFECPQCGEENEISGGDESAVCEGCNAILLIDIDGDGTVSVTTA